MPYIDIQNQDYENTLYLYTIGLENGRYDIIDTEGITDNYSNNATDIHSFDQLINSYNKNSSDKISKYYYNTYNTYRKFISLDSSLLKLNETAITLKLLNNNAYNINKDSSTNIYNLFDFKGIALSYYYPLNGRMATLEDIFAEYFYDYIVALDLLNEALNQGFYYFDKSLPYQLLYSYSIIPIGEIYIDEETNEQETIIYDGTTVPTVEDIILGRVYIVIKSGNMPPRKIYFTNEYGPTLFINDDKYNIKYLGLTNNDTYQYILNDNQTFKLCDITRFRSWGWNLKFLELPDGFILCLLKTENKFFNINIYNDVNLKTSDIKFKIATFAILITTGGDKNSVINFVIGNDLSEITKNNIFDKNNIKFAISDCVLSDENNNNAIWDKLTNYRFSHDAKMGNVLRPKSSDEVTKFVFCMIPYIAINGYGLAGNVIYNNNNITINVTPYNTNDTYNIPIKFLQCILNINYDNILTPYQNNSTEENIKSIYYKNNPKITITENINTDINTNYLGNKFTETDLNINENDINTLLWNNTLLSLNQFENIQDISNYIYGLAIQNIPFKDLHEYKMLKILTVSAYNININVSNLEPGFFTKTDIYLPAYMEYINDNETPIFVEL